MKQTSSKEKIYQQGDVVLKLRNKLPPKAKEVKPTGGYVVVAEGEATGHSHRMPAVDVALLEVEDTKWIDVKKAAPLVHQEHEQQIIAPGLYELWQIREVDPFSEEVRRVMD